MEELKVTGVMVGNCSAGNTSHDILLFVDGQELRVRRPHVYVPVLDGPKTYGVRAQECILTVGAILHGTHVGREGISEMPKWEVVEDITIYHQSGVIRVRSLSV
jgi:hypothetical protein